MTDHDHDPGVQYQVGGHRERRYGHQEQGQNTSQAEERSSLKLEGAMELYTV